ncbi:MAG: response regulator [Anaerolineae bacterium]
MCAQKQRVLVVDDDVQLVDTVRTVLESAEYEVSYAYQAEEGLALAKEEKPDLIMLDIMLARPAGSQGMEASRQIQREPALQGIPVIILSGVKKVLDMPVRPVPDEEYVPVKAFLEKPFGPTELLAKVKEALRPRSA